MASLKPGPSLTYAVMSGKHELSVLQQKRFPQNSAPLSSSKMEHPARVIE
jgi:hypothetical protein